MEVQVADGLDRGAVPLVVRGLDGQGQGQGRQQRACNNQITTDRRGGRNSASYTTLPAHPRADTAAVVYTSEF